ncbi:MAG TPA: choice-of-anchor G family protein, partial [Glaciihabitans sp.]|nr:choice-of-anchor G family protein [Glaciihabitans sp.]
MGTTTALIAFSSGAGAAYAAPGESSNASGQFLSGSLFTAPLSGVVDLGAASASNNGTQETIVDRDDIDLTALGLVNVQLPGGLQLPLNVADAGVLGQYAAANPDGSSVGASGAIGADGQVGVGPTGGSGDLTFDLGGLTGGLGLSPALLAEVSDLNLTVGAVSARASQAAPDAAVGTYTIADADLAFQSDTLASLIGLVDGTVTSLEAQLGGLGTQLEAELLDIPGLGFVVDANLSVDVPSLADAVSDILTQELSSGGVAIDLTTGVVTVDLAVLNDLNNLPPSTNLLGASQL